ncbi:MAG: twin-arginine translocation signal domain-containing protein, partial [Rhizobiales bacterium]|nr:twin-arginine translocation signal domain-containing protein [Hyphomicrobiales bacterium]
MTRNSDIERTKGGVSRRSFLQTSLGVAALAGAGTVAWPQFAAAEGGLVALVHTQAAGDNGPIDSMIAALKKLSGEKGFQTRIVYAQDAATYETIFKSLADAGASIIAATFNEVAEPIKALAPQYPNTKWIQIFADMITNALTYRIRTAGSRP